MSLIDSIKSSAAQYTQKYTETVSQATEAIKGQAGGAVEGQTTAASFGDWFEKPKLHTLEKGVSAKALKGIEEAAVQNGSKAIVSKGDDLVKQGKYDEAKAVYGQLKNPPYAGKEVNLARDLGKLAGDPPRIQADNGKGITTDGEVAKFNSTYEQMADMKMKQTDHVKEMAAKTKLPAGEKFDPQNLDHVKAYFQQVSNENPGKGGGAVVQKEYQRYMDNFTAHPGGKIEWPESPDQNVANFKQLYKDQPKDAAGRTLVNCKSYNYLTEKVLGDVKGADGKPRFETYYATRDNRTHTACGVYDRASGNAFTMSDGKCTDVSSSGFFKEKGVRREDAMRLLTAKQPSIDIAPTKVSDKPDC